MKDVQISNQVIALKNIEKGYLKKNKKNITKVQVLHNINISFELGKFYAITGKSGSGKTTFINILGLLDKFDNGSYFLLGLDVSKLKEKDLCNIRMNNIGFVFQNFYLKPTLKAYENVMLPMLINKKIKPKERKKIAGNLLEQFGLNDRKEHYPSELSGGEQQRVAIARALANNPNIIVADEPTGNLDPKYEDEIFKTLKNLSQDNKCVIVVSHSEHIKKYADIVYRIEDGIIIGE